MLRSTLLLILLATGFFRPAMAVQAVVHHAVFRTEAGAAYVEYYWNINPAYLHYRKDSLGNLVALVKTQIRISSDTGIVLREDYYLKTRPFNPELSEAPPILEQLRTELPAGKIKLELYLTEDGRPDGDFYHRDTLTVLPLQGVAYSSVQLLDTFFLDAGAGMRQKGGYTMVPRPLNFYDEGERRLHAYAELYGLRELAAADYPLRQTVFLSHKAGERDLAGFILLDTLAGPSDLERFRRSFTLETLPSGNYHINFALRTAAGAPLAAGSAFFQMLNKNPVVPVDTGKKTASSVEQVQGTYLDLKKTFVSKFDMPQLRAIMKMLLPSVQPSEEAAIKGFLERPDELYMRYFIFNHFSNKNKADPAKAWKEFSDVVREVNRLYKSGSTMGYETDRGIIHLRYGTPAEVVRVPNEAGAVPYEIWRYNVGGKIGGSGLFLFYSPGFMSSDFRLLHSTVPGERNNPAWRAVLYSTGRSSGNANARADEYFGR